MSLSTIPKDPSAANAMMTLVMVFLHFAGSFIANCTPPRIIIPNHIVIIRVMSILVNTPAMLVMTLPSLDFSMHLPIKGKLVFNLIPPLRIHLQSFSVLPHCIHF